ncbi:MAG: response regulator transcription factor [Lachnospiraceae bacterium]|nr:response regulator transcription factor [Lachnospiraceae bacterium]
MKSIMVIDDDIYINKLLEESLVSEGYSVTKAFSGTEAQKILSKVTPDLILMDLMLPGLTGEELLPKIGNIPVIVVSAKVDINNKVDLLMKGAADYVTKPFDMKELLARIVVALRKQESANALESDVITAGDIRLDTSLLTVTMQGQDISLTRTECAILKLLMQHEGRPLGRNTILEKISMDTPDCTERSLKQHISNIRKKLEAVSGIDHIETVYGIGFKFRQS